MTGRGPVAREPADRGARADARPDGGTEAGRDGAKALLLTVLGEFVLPGPGAAWTAALLDGLAALGVNERNARQALARLGDDGIVRAARVGRRARWELTEEGRRLLGAGAERIYSFGGGPPGWSGEWLVVHCSVPDNQRAVRHRLQRQLSFAGFGFVAPGVALSPHTVREGAVAKLLADLGLAADAIVLRARSAGPTSDADLVARAWDLGTLEADYRAFHRHFAQLRPGEPAAAFASTVALVHAWRRFPFADPELPSPLLPAGWAGAAARRTFLQRRQQWADAAHGWFAAREAAAGGCVASRPLQPAR